MISYLNSVQFRPTCVFQWITFVSIAEATGCLMQSYLINNDGRPREHCNHFILNAYYVQFKADCLMHQCTDAIEGDFDCSSQIRGRVLGRGQAWWAGCTKSTKLKGFEARGPAIIESCVQFRVTLRISQHIWRSLWTDQSIWRGLPNHISRKSPH